MNFIVNIKPRQQLKREEITKIKQKTTEGSAGLGAYTSYNGQYREAPPQKGSFSRLQVRLGVLQVEVYERVGKSVI